MKRFLGLRPVRHIAVTSALVLAVCAGVFLVQYLEFSHARDTLRELSARATATVVGTGDDTGTVEFPLPGGGNATATVALDGSPPKTGTRVPVGYDPHEPANAVIPGATPLVTADRASSYATAAVVAALLVLAVDAVVLATRFRRPAGSAARRVLVRRVKFQRGLVTRSWLETGTANPRWIPVYFSPTLIGLTSPTEAEVYGDPARDRRVTVRIGDETLYPAGAVRHSEPRGRRTDNPAEPDEERRAAAGRPVTLARQFRVDLPVLVPAPFAGLFWALVDGTGVPGWLTVTALFGAAGFWWASLRGSDPS
ncbi:hypothetical protein [Amycolatopsis samaneae]|uniref:DUF3592 domain-containing protein n=1 Tax=Amycolatopsis samaneae TaxID=664691 RepID=A0ABW5GB74_9PSEU